MMKAMIVDDEALLLGEFKKILGSFDDIEVAGSYTDPFEADAAAVQIQPDIAFLDIEMTGMTGIELAERLLCRLPSLQVCFVTAYNHYAAEAFSANAVDYLLKPVMQERLARTLDKMRRGTTPAVPVEGLRIQSFGKFGVFFGEEPVRWIRAKQRELFAYLLQHEGRWLDKYRICEDLWGGGNPEQSLASLQTAVWAVRKVMKEAGLHMVKIDYANDSYLLRVGDARWDKRVFEASFSRYSETGDPAFRREAVEQYRSGYLFQEDWPWSLEEQARYARLYELLVRKADDTKQMYVRY